MKRLILILGFILFAAMLNAQETINKVISSYGVAGASFENYASITGTTRNYGFSTHKLLHQSAKIAAYNYTFQLNVPGPYYFVYSAHLRDFEAGTANTASVYLKGSLDNIQYQTLDTLSYASVADSLTCIAGSNDLLYINDTDRYPLNPLAYKYLRITVTPAGDSIWVKSLWLNVLPVNK
jgi:hypothetical protein